MKNMKHQNSFSYLLGNISLFKCFLLVIFVSGCISQNKSPFESLKEKDVKYVIIEKYYNHDIHNLTVVVDSAKRTYSTTYDTIYSDVIKNEIITALKDSHQETIKFPTHMTLVLKRDSDDIRIGVKKNYIKTRLGTFVCKTDIESLLQN